MKEGNIMKDFLNSAFGNVIVSLLTIGFTTLIITLVNYLFKKLRTVLEKYKCEKLDFYLCKIQEIVNTCVKATNQTFVNQLKNEGNFTDQAKKDAFDITYSSVKSIAGDYLEKVFGDNTTAIMTYISNLIEDTVSNYTIEGKKTIKTEIDDLYSKYKDLQYSAPSTYESLKKDNIEKFGILQNDIMKVVNDYRENKDLSNPEEFNNLQKKIVEMSNTYTKMM